MFSQEACAALHGHLQQQVHGGVEKSAQGGRMPCSSCVESTEELPDRVRLRDLLAQREMSGNRSERRGDRRHGLRREQVIREAMQHARVGDGHLAYGWDDSASGVTTTWIQTFTRQAAAMSKEWYMAPGLTCERRVIMKSGGNPSLQRQASGGWPGAAHYRSIEATLRYQESHS